MEFQVNLTHKYKTMPRLSLYRPNRTYDYQYLDRNISEMFTVGGIDILVHKYLGPQLNPDQTNSPGDVTIPTYGAEVAERL